MGGLRKEWMIKKGICSGTNEGDWIGKWRGIGNMGFRTCSQESNPTRFRTCGIGKWPRGKWPLGGVVSCQCWSSISPAANHDFSLHFNSVWSNLFVVETFKVHTFHFLKLLIKDWKRLVSSAFLNNPHPISLDLVKNLFHFSGVNKYQCPIFVPNYYFLFNYLFFLKKEVYNVFFQLKS